jgi:hypothetical protein
LRQLRDDPDWVSRRADEDEMRRAWSLALRDNEQPLVEDLRSAGFDVESVWDLFNRKEPWRRDVPIPAYPEAIPLLLRHLRRPYHFSVREGIVRALTAREGRIAFDSLVEEFLRTRDSGAEERARAVELVAAQVKDLYSRGEIERITAANWESFRAALANAVATHARKEHAAVIRELLEDARHGRECRAALADALRRRMKRSRWAEPELVELLDRIRRE